ncbi:hypothetical protein BH10PLA1_BH10PLA1_05620 [soil metagenome]
MKYCFSTLGCPNWSIDRIAEQASAMGFDGVELRASADGNHLRPDASDDECAAVRSAFESRHVAIACLMGYTNFATADVEVRYKSEQECIALIRIASRLGCPTVRIFGGDPKAADLAVPIERVVGSLLALVPQAEAANVRLAMETHDAWCRSAPLMEVMSRVRSPALGVCWDYANMAGKVTIEEAWQAMKSRVIHVHSKDIADLSHRAVLMGEGIARSADAIGLLHAGGYDGWLSFEWEKKWQPAIPEPEVAFPHWLTFVKLLEPT